MIRLGAAMLAAAVLGFAPSAWAHDGEDHKQAGGEPTWQPAAGPPAAVVPFGLDVGGPFELLDHHGRVFTDTDLEGDYSLVFFGYARCEGVCPLGLRRMTEAVDLLGKAAARVRPVLITVDPEETPEILAERVTAVHPRLTGLTGTVEQLAAAAAAYKVKSSRIGTAMDGSQVFRHGSYIYVMSPKGELLSILPPVLSAEAMAVILRQHLQGQAGSEG